MGSKIATKLFFAAILASVVLSVLLSAYKYLLQRNYLLYMKVACNPEAEECFFETCAEDDVRCSHSGEEHYFKVVYKRESDIDCSAQNCESISCMPQDKDCKIVYCSERAIEDLRLDATCEK